MKLIMEIEFEYDADLMHDEDEEGRAWFYDEILKGSDLRLLDAGNIGDEIGTVRVLSIKQKEVE